MNQKSTTSWNELEPFRSLGYVVSILGGIAGIISLLPWLFAPRGDLQATYTHTKFTVPTYLSNPDKRDTAITQRENAIYKLYRNLLEQRHVNNIFSYPDSLRPATLMKGSYGYSTPPLRDFTISHKGLIDLTIYNAGDKALTSIKVVHKGEVYYEFEDSNNHLHQGSTKERFLIGDLDPKETRTVTMWTLQPSSYRESEVSVAYSEGVVDAVRPEELTGKSAWLVRNVFTFTNLMLLLGFAPLTLSAISVLVKLRRR